MFLHRLIFDARECTITTDFNPHLTVVEGLDPSARASLAARVAHGLIGDPDGIHAEIRTGGRNLAVFRPTGAPHRVVDVDRQRDVTATFSDDAGTIELLRGRGLSAVQAALEIHIPRERVGELVRFPSVVVSQARPLAMAVATTAVVTSLLPGAGPAVAIWFLAAAAAAILLAMVVGGPMDTEDLDDYIATAGRASGEDTLPVVLVDPFEAVSAERRPRLLAALRAAAQHTQIIAVTDDQEVIDLARSVTGDDVTVARPALHHRMVRDDVGTITAS